MKNKIFISLILLIGLVFYNTPTNVNACLDPVTNFGIVTVSTTYDASATSVVLNGGDGAKLPATSTCSNPDFGFNVTWYDDTTYPGNPTGDPNREIVRVTAVSTDTLTVIRAQEGTSASTKNTAGKTYKMILNESKKTHDDNGSKYNRSDFENWYEIATDFLMTGAQSNVYLFQYGLKQIISGSGGCTQAGTTGNNEMACFTSSNILNSGSVYNQHNDSAFTARSIALSSTPISFKTRINTGQTGTTQKLVVFGLTDSTTLTTGANGFDSAGTGHMVGFRVSEAGSVSWVATVNKNAASETVTSSGVTDSSAYHTYEMTATNTAVNYYIDGVWLTGAAITTNIPTVALTPFIGVQTLDANNKVIWVDWLKYKSPRL